MTVTFIIQSVNIPGLENAMIDSVSKDTVCVQELVVLYQNKELMANRQ
jgi:hypothetical protein